MCCLWYQGGAALAPWCRETGASQSIVRLHAERSFRNLIKSNRNQIVFTTFRLIWNQTDVCLVPNPSENSKYNLISVWFDKIYLSVRFNMADRTGRHLFRLPEKKVCFGCTADMWALSLLLFKGQGRTISRCRFSSPLPSPLSITWKIKIWNMIFHSIRHCAHLSCKYGHLWGGRGLHILSWEKSDM